MQKWKTTRGGPLSSSRLTAMKKLEGSLPPKTGQANPSTKRKPSKKVDRPPKKPKIVMRSTVGETLTINKLPPSLVQEREKD